VSSSRGVPGATEAGEDLAADRVVPVAERGPDGRRVSCPRPAAEDLVAGPEEHLRVLAVGKRREPGVGLEVRAGPLPDVADHAQAAHGRRALRARADGGGPEPALAEVRVLRRRPVVPPRVAAGAPAGRVPRRRLLPFRLRRAAPPPPAG